MFNKNFMAIFWYKRDAKNRLKYCIHEYNKIILKGLLSDSRFVFNQKLYLRRLFDQYDKTSSVSFYRRSCLFTGHSRAVFKTFKLCRHQTKYYATNGFISGIRKASF